MSQSFEGRFTTGRGIINGTLSRDSVVSGLGPRVPGLSTGVIVCSPAYSTFHALSSCTK